MRANDRTSLTMLNLSHFDSGSEDSYFGLFLDMFLQSDRVACFSEPFGDDQINGHMEDMVEGRLSPVDMQELFGKLRSDPSAVARLALLLQKTKCASKEGREE